jgi:hypothetical protein
MPFPLSEKRIKGKGHYSEGWRGLPIIDGLNHAQRAE